MAWLLVYVIGWFLIYFSYGPYAAEQGLPIPKYKLIGLAFVWPGFMAVAVLWIVVIGLLRLIRFSLTGQWVKGND